MNHPAKLNFTTQIALTVALILWSSAFVGIRISLVGYTPGSLALLRFLIASVCIYFICLFLPKRNKIHRHDKFKLLLIGAVTGAGYHVALNYGELTVSSGIASFIISQSPIFTCFLSFFLLHERIHLRGYLGMLVSAVGVTIILSSHKEIHFAMASFYVVIAALLGSIYNVSQKNILKKYNALDVTSYFIYGTALALLLYLKPLSHEIFLASTTATLSAIYLGIFPAAIAYWAWTYVLAHMSATRASNFVYWMPIITLLLGWIFLNEVPPFIAVLGGLIALCGVWIVNHSYYHQKVYLTRP
jgi:drug/metabolite transporter (DMT)-like permease